MKFYFEPESTFVVTHERKVRAIVDEINPATFDGSLLVSHYWSDHPVQLTLRKVCWSSRARSPGIQLEAPSLRTSG